MRISARSRLGRLPAATKAAHPALARTNGALTTHVDSHRAHKSIQTRVEGIAFEGATTLEEPIETAATVSSPSSTSRRQALRSGRSCASRAVRDESRIGDMR